MTNSLLSIKMVVEAILNSFFSVKSQKGVTMIEYALIAALVALIAIGAFTILGGDMTGAFNKIGDTLNPSTGS